MKTKKILSVVLAVLMITGVFAVGASAMDSDEITEKDFYVAGTHLSDSYYLVADGGITAENASASNYNVKFAPATATTNARITFNNAKNITRSTEINNGTAVVASGGKLDVELIGENSFSGSEAAFYCAGGINFIGDGSLSYTTDRDAFINSLVLSESDNITVGDRVQINVSIPDDILSVAFVTFEGEVIIKDNAKVNIKNTGTGIMSPGLKVSDNAEVTVDCGRRYGGATEIINGDVSISGNAVVNLSTTREIGFEEDDETLYALSIENGNLSVSGNAQLNANSGGGYQSVAIYMKGNESEKTSLTVSDSAIIQATTKETTASNYGIFIDNANNSVITTKDNAKISVITGYMRKGEDYSAYGVSGCCGISAAEIDASGNSSIKSYVNNAFYLDEDSKMKGDCVGIYTNTLTTSDYARIEVTACKGKGRSTGVYCADSLTAGGNSWLGIDGGSTGSIDDGNGSEECIGIYVENLLKITDSAKVSGVGGMANAFSYGAWATNIEISGDGGLSTRAYNVANGPSVGILCRNNINISEKSYISGDAGITENSYSKGIQAFNLFATDNACVDGTGGIADIAAGIHIEKNTVLSDNVRVDAGSCDATTATAGFFTENFKATDNVSVTAYSNDANQTFAFDVKTADISGSVEIYGESGSGDGVSMGVILVDGATIGENCKITGNAASSSTESPMTAGVYSDGVLTLNGNASVTGKSLNHYGIAVKEFTVSDNAIFEAEGGKQAVYCQKFTLNGHEDYKITVVRSDMSEQKMDWDREGELGSLDNFYSYVSIAPAEPEPELNFFEQIIASIVNFFNKIAEFFSSIFSFAN